MPFEPTPAVQPTQPTQPTQTSQPIETAETTETTQPVPTFTAARDRERIGLWAAAQARTSVPEPEPSVGSGPGTSEWAEDSGDSGDYPPEYGTDERYPGTAVSGRPTVKQKEERLAVAAGIVHARPEITGTELRAELERQGGWSVTAPPPGS